MLTSCQLRVGMLIKCVIRGEIIPSLNLTGTVLTVMVLHMYTAC